MKKNDAGGNLNRLLAQINEASTNEAQNQSIKTWTLREFLVQRSSPSSSVVQMAVFRFIS
jgi:hypothetical protein